MNIPRLIRTIRHLRPRQAAWLVYRRLRPFSPARAAGAGAVTLRPGVSLAPRPYASRFATVSADRLELEFLNVRRSFALPAIDWHPQDVSRLWRYHLHYFDSLVSENLSAEQRDRLIDDWIAANPTGTPDGWEAYPTSLRIVNWIDYFLRTAEARPLKRSWLHSLYAQALWLERNIEHHLRANHLLKNIVALVFAGTFFTGPDADRWRRRGERMLATETNEQFLSDGGHFERSPMYHAIATQDLLDVLNLWRNSPASRGASVEALSRAADRALRALADMTHPDGGLALFNDAAHGVAVPTAELHDYASHILPPARPASASPSATPALIRHPRSGYYGFRAGDDYLIVDCGPVGPNDQPGHAHCDLLSFELSLAGRRLFVDAGVSGYDDDPARGYVRSTAAHNTVLVGGVEQSEMWGTFRVGRRARPLAAYIEASDGVVTFRGAHDGYRHLPQRVVHARTVTWDPHVRVLLVEDRFDGVGRIRVESFLHVAPDVAVNRAGRDFELVRSGQRIARVCLGGNIETELASGLYCPEFGRRLPAQVLAMRREDLLPFQLSISIAA